jgi:pyruvate,water dikinase
METGMISTSIIPLHSRAARKETYSGGKAARLAELSSKGLPVPPGFVIAASWHRRLLPSQEPDSLDISRSEFSARLPGRARNSIVRAFHRLNGPVSVRSSMIGEDSDRRSFAGQLRTVLMVTGENDLFEAIHKCYLSLERTSFRRYSNNVVSAARSDQGTLAILVQRMVEARAAGVAFSADPNTGSRCIIIEATTGLGSTMVSGRVVPDRYIIAPPGKMAQRDVTSQNEPVLSERQIRQLIELVERIHSHMGAPQDIEWAWDGSQFWVLQSRPITSLYGQHLFSNRLVSDMTPGLIKPLLWSTNIADMMENVFGRIFRSLLGRIQIEPTALVKRFHSRIYADMSLFGELLWRLGLPTNFFEMITHDERSQGGHLRLTGRLVRSAARMALFISRYGRIQPSVCRFITCRRQRLDPSRQRDWPGKHLRELFDRSLALRNDHGHTQWYMWVTAMNMMFRRKLLSRFLKRHAPGVTTQQLLSGLVGLKSLEPNHRLKRMASRAKKLPSKDHKVLLASDDGSIRSQLRQTLAGRELLADFDDFMQRYGFLSSSGTDFTVSPWREHPDLIWRGIGRLMNREEEDPRSSSADIRERSVRRVQSRLRFPQSRVFQRLLRSTREYVKLRERISFLMSEDVSHMRRLYLAMGDRLVAGGGLSQPDDIFYLSFPELASMVDGSADGALLIKRIASRRKALIADASISIDDVFYGPPRHRRPYCDQTPGPYLEGIIGSLGRAQGIARILRNPSEINTTLTKRDILVVPHTDVGWTPLFPSIGGIVAETGGQLSHSAIIAREYGLPAVVSVRKATRVIREGQPITLDGDHGRVYLERIDLERIGVEKEPE